MTIPQDIMDAAGKGSTPPKLTKTQSRALNQLSTGRVNGKYMPVTLLQLVALGYAKKEMSAIGWHWMFAITEAGRAVVELQRIQAANPSPAPKTRLSPST